MELESIDETSMYIFIEELVNSSSANEVVEAMKKYKNTAYEKSFPMAIQTLIAIGNREDLEKKFPKYKGANPKYSFES